MGIQETAQDVKHLVQALAEGKTVEYRARATRGASGTTTAPVRGSLASRPTSTSTASSATCARSCSS